MFSFLRKGKKGKAVIHEEPAKDPANDTKVIERDALIKMEECEKMKKEVEQKSEDVKKRAETAQRRLAKK